MASKVVLTNQPLDRARKKRRFLESISVESEDILVLVPGFVDETKIFEVDNDDIKIMPNLSISIMKDVDILTVFFRYQISASDIKFLKIKFISIRIQYMQHLAIQSYYTNTR